jgi:hypothetical protein
MKNAFTQTLCRLLAVTLMLMPWQTGQAAMIGTDQATSMTSVQADRDVVASFLTRTQAVNELSALGIDAKTAQDRVAAMTDGEVSSLAGKIAALPAGGDGIVILILVLLIVWLVLYRR